MRLSKDNTDQIRKRYNRIAFFYNILEAPMEWLRFRQWRNRLRTMITGPRALEVGVGTGKNLPYYPPYVDVTAIDFSPQMLENINNAGWNIMKDEPLSHDIVRWFEATP